MTADEDKPTQQADHTHVVVTGVDAVENLATQLLRKTRGRVAVVVSSAREGTRVDPAALAKRVGADADVYLLATSTDAFTFDDLMPAGTSVYGGAVRAYPPNTDWTRNPNLANLYAVFSVAEADRIIDQVAEDVEAMAILRWSTMREVTKARDLAQQRKRETLAEDTPEIINGIVALGLGDEPSVILDDGDTVDLILPGCDATVPATMLVTDGQAVSGTLHRGAFSLHERRTPVHATDHAKAGRVLPALVASESRVVLHPGLIIRFRNDAHPGDVIAVRVDTVGRPDGKAWRLEPVSDDEVEDAVDALPYLAGGEPWITLHPELPDEADDSEAEGTDDTGLIPVEEWDDEDIAVLEALDSAAARVRHLASERARLAVERDLLQDTVDTLSEELDQVFASQPAAQARPDRVEVTRLRSQLTASFREKREIASDLDRALSDADKYAAEATALHREVERLRENIRTERDRATRARRASQPQQVERDDAVLFSDPVEQFRYEVYLDWARRIPAESKASHPLAEYQLGERFLDSVDALEGIDRSKIISVVNEVLTGLADKMASREMHRLRDGAPGRPAVTDSELGTAWRVSLQVNTASARRLHFWRGADGKIVLAKVGLHDDMSM